MIYKIIFQVFFLIKLVEKLGINPALPVEEILDQLSALDPLKFQDLGYMFEEFVRAPMPFKVQLSCQIVYYYLYSFEKIFLDCSTNSSFHS